MRFKPDPRLVRDLRAQPAYKAALARAAGPARAEAQRIADDVGAPWMRRAGVATVVIDATGEKVRLVNTDYGGALMEFGSANNPPHAPLRRGAQSAGLRLGEDPGT